MLRAPPPLYRTCLKNWFWTDGLSTVPRVWTLQRGASCSHFYERKGGHLTQKTTNLLAWDVASSKVIEHKSVDMLYAKIAEGQAVEKGGLVFLEGPLFMT